jgi:hypothetical protein
MNILVELNNMNANEDVMAAGGRSAASDGGATLLLKTG